LTDNRRYSRLSAIELWDLFTTNKSHNLEVLRGLKNELKFRTKKSARELEAQVDLAINNLISVQDDYTDDNDDDDIGIAGEILLRPWQIEALQAWKTKGYVGVVEAVTGAGKTHVALSAMLNHLRMGWKVVVVVPSVALQEQWYKKIIEIINLGLENHYRVNQMGGSKKSDGDFDILIAVSNSASKYLLLPAGERGLLITDECHRYGCKTWSRVLEPEFERRLGLTATYDRMDSGLEDFLDPYFNAVCYSLTYKQALDEDVIANFKIAFIGVEFDDEESKAYEETDELCRKLRSKLINQYGVPAEPFGKFMKEVSAKMKGGNEDNEVRKIARRYMSNFNNRRKLVANAKQKMECLRNLVPSFEAAERSIIFAQTKEAAEQAVEILVEENLNAKVLDATMSIKDRKAVFADFENGEEDIVAAPMLLDEGIDVPSADLAIILASSRSSRQMIQRMGRVLRKKEDGRLARVAIIYVKGTMEDPEQGAHEVFIDKIRDVATDEVTFYAEDYEEICYYLNDWDDEE